ncbi:MAG TPA: xanthine dehydrogenase family protein molybdopterin-binding subunit [Anaerolineaceae bacterium]|nr:xanthine dehydrogenase family protein molybdopterin-binding subunit [Anaerolineaceae bacterium]
MSKAVGASHQRIDGVEKVTGAAKYVADSPPARVLTARVFRSSVGHARITRLDVSRAQAYPGVRAVVTGKDCPRRFGYAIQDQFPIAVDKVRFWGEPVAVVVANTVEQAQEAMELIEVEFEPLEVLLHPRDAARPGAVAIHEDLAAYSHIPLIYPEPERNVAHHYRLRKGEVEPAFEQAHLVVENDYWVPWIAHIPIEPHGTIGIWDGQGYTLWTSSQSPFYVRDTIAEMFEMSPADVRVQVPYVGGGFGGKSDVTIEPLLAVAARAVPNVAVELILTREESIFGTVVGRGAWGHFKTAVDREGMLLAQEVCLYFGSGGYADYSVWIVQGGGHNSTGPYYFPNIQVDSYAVYTNTPPTGAYRGYGHPEVHWMVERQMDIIARKLGMDPVRLRLQNLLSPGKANALGQVMQPYNGKPAVCLTTVVEALGEPTRATEPHKVRGQGIACFMKSPVMRTNAQSGAILQFSQDGTVRVFTGAVEIGQGLGTVMCQIAAETLGIPVDQVRYGAEVDTQFSPHEWQTVASHTTWAVGNAVRLAAEDALEQLKQSAAKYFELPVDSLVVQAGRIYPTGEEDRAITFKQIGLGITCEDGSSVNPPVIGRGSFVPKGLTYPDRETGQGNVAASWTFGSQGAEVEVDLQTGQVEVLKLVSAQDAGKIINPTAAKSQVEGAITMALGAAFMEKLHFRPDGRIMNTSFVDYRIPSSVDVPGEIEVHFVETEDAVGPYGARGVGEHGIVAVPAVIANAVADALGIELFEIPMTPQVIIEKLGEHQERR